MMIDYDASRKYSFTPVYVMYHPTIRIPLNRLRDVVFGLAYRYYVGSSVEAKS